MTPPNRPSDAVYRPGLLRLYDLIVARLSNPLLWRVSTRRLRRLYQTHVSARHLDVGVGTGYFLDKCGRSVAGQELTLLDSNRHCLEFAARRLRRFSPQIHEADIMQSVEVFAEPFHSMSLNYVLHCLPGDFEQKGVVLDHLRPLLAPEAPLFGATLLGADVSLSRPAQRLMDYYNQRGIFCNRTDSLTGLTGLLEAKCASYNLETAGCAAIFVARF